MVAKHLSFIVLILFVRTIVSAPTVNLQRVKRNFSESTLQAINYVNKTTVHVPHGCDKTCVYIRELRRLLKNKKHEGSTFTETKSYF